MALDSEFPLECLGGDFNMSSEMKLQIGENGFESRNEVGVMETSASARPFVVKARNRGENKKEIGLLLL